MMPTALFIGPPMYLILLHTLSVCVHALTRIPQAHTTVPHMPITPPPLVLTASDRALISRSTKSIVNNRTSIVNPHNFNYTLLETNMCRPDTFVLVVVHSAPAHYKRRAFIRHSFGSRQLYDRLKMVVVFVLGTPAIDEHRTQQMIQREHELYHDIVQENFVDTYRNLTYKAVAWLKWTTKYCAHPPFMLKVRAWVHSTRKMRVQIDDDVLVNPFVLVRHLKHMQKTGYGAKNTISCLRWDKVQVRSAHECAQAALAQVVRNKKSKWYVSESEYAGQVYPPYCSGSAWVFSMDLVPRMLNASYTQPFFWIDDFYITGSLAVAVGARFNQMRSLYTVTGYDADLATHERRLLNDRAVFGHFPKSKTQLMWPLWKQILRQYT